MYAYVKVYFLIQVQPYIQVIQRASSRVNCVTLAGGLCLIIIINTVPIFVSIIIFMDVRCLKTLSTNSTGDTESVVGVYSNSSSIKPAGFPLNHKRAHTRSPSSLSVSSRFPDAPLGRTKRVPICTHGH